MALGDALGLTAGQPL
jgi:hypothetical protein